MGEEQVKIETQEQQEVSLVITLKPNGGITITGPIQNKILAFGMLKIAEGLVNDFKGNVVQPAKGGILNFARQRF